jgi:type I restriction enzyme M protein
MPFLIADIFKSEETPYRLTQFRIGDIQELETSLFEKNGKPYLKCLASDKDRPAKPEEIVRQLWIKKLLDEYRVVSQNLC